MNEAPPGIRSGWGFFVSETSTAVSVSGVLWRESEAAPAGAGTPIEALPPTNHIIGA